MCLLRIDDIQLFSLYRSRSRPVSPLSLFNNVRAIHSTWPGGVMVKAFACDSRGREFNFRPFRCQRTTLGKLFAHMCLCHQGVFSTSSRAAMSCDWEGNRRSGVALAMRPRIKWFIHLRAQGPSKGDEHTTNTPHGVWYSLPLLIHSAFRNSLAFGPSALGFSSDRNRRRLAGNVPRPRRQNRCVVRKRRNADRSRPSYLSAPWNDLD